MNYNKFTLGISEIYLPNIHGLIENSSQNICEKILVYCIFEADEFYDSEYEAVIDILKNCYELIYENNNYNHPTIRNYRNIINNNNYIKLDIIQIEILPTEETVCVIKTFWIKIIQRKWKKVYKERKMLLQNMKNPLTLMKRECSGKFPIKIRNYPEFKVL